MSLVSKSIPSFLNGVSQQPASLRGPSQVEASVNALPLPAVGLIKRPPTIHTAKLANAPYTDAYTHIINISPTERYFLVVTDGDVQVFGEDGTEHTVTAADRAAWVVNTAYSVGDIRAPTTPNGFLYRVTVAGTSHAATEPTWPTTLAATVVDNTVTWECIPDYLNCTTARTDFAALSVEGHTFVLNKTITVSMAAAVVAGSLYSTVQTFSTLPAHSAGRIVKIEGDNTNRFDNYYVKSDGTTWNETANPGEQYKFDDATMPWRLRKTGATTWVFERCPWVARTVGDLTTVPNLTFVGATISDIFVHRNRLGFLSGPNVVLGKSGDFFNFFPGTATQVLADDPIDKKAPPQNANAATLRYAIPFNKALLPFSDTTQYQFTGGDVLTPSTARIDPITEFESFRDCRPVAAGQEVFFTIARGENTAVRNYYIDTEALTNDASDISSHVPSYIPKDVYKMSVSTSDDMLFALTLDERNAIYVYKWYWQDDKRVQAAWQKLAFDDGDEILSVDFLSSIAYILVQRADGVYFEKMDVQPNAIDDVGYLVRLDRRVELTGVYDAGNGWTTWTLPYEDAGTFQVVLGDTFTGQGGQVYDTTRPSSTTVRVTGDKSAGPCFVGRVYEMRVRLTEIYMKDQQQQPILTGKLMLKTLTLAFSDTGYFRVEVTPLGRDAYSYAMNGLTLGISGLVIGNTVIGDGEFTVPIRTQNKGCVIEVVNDTPLPSAIQTAEWVGEFTLKSRRQ